MSLFLDIVCSIVGAVVCIGVWLNIGPHVKDVMKYNDIRAYHRGQRPNRSAQRKMRTQDDAQINQGVDPTEPF